MVAVRENDSDAKFGCHETGGQAMKEKICRTQVVRALALWFCAVMVSSNAHGGLQSAPQKEPNGQQSTITVPARAGTPLYKGTQGAQRSEVVFSPSSRTVTIKCRVQDPNGYFVPNIRRENFAVYEDGVRQTNADVEIEHAPVSVAVLMEFGGRYHELNKALATTVHEALRHFIDVIGPHDKIALFKYGSTVETLADFTSDREALNKSFSQLDTPDSSEANFYDALIDTLHRVQAAGTRWTKGNHRYLQRHRHLQQSKLPAGVAGVSRRANSDLYRRIGQPDDAGGGCLRTRGALFPF